MLHHEVMDGWSPNPTSKIYSLTITCTVTCISSQVDILTNVIVVFVKVAFGICLLMQVNCSIDSEYLFLIKK